MERQTRRRSDSRRVDRSNDDRAVPSVDSEDIAHRAFELYCARGCEDGHDVDDWLQAEQELRASGERTKIDGRSPLMGAEEARASGELETGQARPATSPESHAEVFR